MTVTKFFEILPYDLEINSACELWNLVKDSNLIHEHCLEDLRRSIKTIVGLRKRIDLYGLDGTIALLNERGLEINAGDTMCSLVQKIKDLEMAAV